MVGDRSGEVQGQNKPGNKQEFLLLSAVSRDWEDPFLKMTIFLDTSMLLPNKDPDIGTIVGRVLEFLQQVKYLLSAKTIP